jgi:hypothetical protein
MSLSRWCMIFSNATKLEVGVVKSAIGWLQLQYDQVLCQKNKIAIVHLKYKNLTNIINFIYI